MKKQKNFKSQRGITLVALIITIIVLVILAAVAINVALNTGIINFATKGVKDYAEAGVEENRVMNKAIDFMESTTKKIEGILGGTGGEPVSREGIKIGDYIEYKPDNFDAVDIPTYSATKLGETYTGYSSNTDIQQDRNMKWQVLKIYDNGEIDIIGTPTSQEVYLKGATGYNNGVYILNDICEKLYSRKDDSIYARSVNIEDFENAETEAGTAAKKKYISDTINGVAERFKNRPESYPAIKSVDTENNTVTLKNISYPNLYEKEKGSGIPDKKITTEGIGRSDNAALDMSTEEAARKQAENLTVTQTYYDISISGSNYGDAERVFVMEASYYLSSRAVSFMIDVWGEFAPTIWEVLPLDGYCGSNYMSMDLGNTKPEASALRPVVHLGSNVKIQQSNSADDYDTPHTITSYK